MEEWEIDIEGMTLNDLEILEAGLNPGAKAGQLKQVLGRLVANKSAEDIGNIPLRELRGHIEQLTAKINELSIPKARATP